MVTAVIPLEAWKWYRHCAIDGILAEPKLEVAKENTMAFPQKLKPETLARMEADMARHSAERFQTACDLVMGKGDPNIWASSVLGFMRRAGIICSTTL